MHLTTQTKPGLSNEKNHWIYHSIGVLCFWQFFFSANIQRHSSRCQGCVFVDQYFPGNSVAHPYSILMFDFSRKEFHIYLNDDLLTSDKKFNQIGETLSIEVACHLITFFARDQLSVFEQYFYFFFCITGYCTRFPENISNIGGNMHTWLMLLLAVSQATGNLSSTSSFVIDFSTRSLFSYWAYTASLNILLVGYR